MKSIRQYVYIRLVWGVGILIVSTLLLGLSIHHLDIREYDANLEEEARTLATFVVGQGKAVKMDLAGGHMPQFETASNTEYFQIRLREGSLIERSGMLGERDLPFLPEALEAPVFMNLLLPDGRPGRFVQITFTPRSMGEDESSPDSRQEETPTTVALAANNIVLGFAQSREGLNSELTHIYFMLVAMDVLLITFVLTLAQFTLKKAFLPIADLNAQLQDLGAGKLDKRIELAVSPAEIEAVAAALNSTLDVLQAVFVRERRFISDAAHELRTPVAEFRAACDVGLKWSDDPVLVKNRFRNLQESAINMERILKGFLDLSRLDSGAGEVDSTPVQVASLVDSSWMRVLNGGIEPDHSLENAIDPALNLNTDPIKLEQIFLNLLNNAASYSPSGSVILCKSRRTLIGEWSLHISNPVCALEPEDMEHIFDRFWRKEAARTGGLHSGLGLSIVKALADVLGIRVTAHLTCDGVFTASIRFSSQSIC